MSIKAVPVQDSRGPVSVVAPRHAPRGVPSDTLAALLAATANRDVAAFTALYDRTCSRLCGVALRVLRDPGYALETTRDVYLQVWNTAHRFDPREGSPLAWLTTLTHRHSVDRVRAEATRATADGYPAHDPPTPHRPARPTQFGSVRGAARRGRATRHPQAMADVVVWLQDRAPGSAANDPCFSGVIPGEAHTRTNGEVTTMAYWAPHRAPPPRFDGGHRDRHHLGAPFHRRRRGRQPIVLVEVSPARGRTG